MKKLLISLFVTLMTMSSYGATAIINFTGKTSNGNNCQLDKVEIENLTQGWTETIFDQSLSIEIVDKDEAIDGVIVDKDFLITNTLDGKAQVLFNMQKDGQVSVFVYDIAGRCLCKSITTQEAGRHALNLEFSTPQMYYLHISTPTGSYAHPILNMHSSNNTQIQYVTNIAKSPALFTTEHTCHINDEMRYTGYSNIYGEWYTDIKNGTIQDGNINVEFTFDVSENTTLPAPTGFTVSQTSSYIQLLWNEVSGAAGYYIAVLSETASDWEYYETSSTSVQFEGFAAGTYAFSVCAYDSEGNAGEWSEDKYITFIGSSIPNTPSDLAASANSSCISLSWNKVSGAIKYNVYRSTSASGTYSYIDYTPFNFYSDCSVSAGTTYYYKVSAENNIGESSQSSYASAKVSGGTTSKPSTPSGLSASANSSCISLSWYSVSGATRYNVYRSTSASGTYSYIANTSSAYYSDCSVSAGTTYYYKVSAENSAGESSQSSYASAKVTSGGSTKLSAPTGVTATAGSYSITVKWNSVSGANKYNVYRSTSSSSGYSQVSTEYGTSYIDSNVKSGTTYYYKVAAVASDGTVGTQSSYISAKINSGGGTTTVSAPTNVNASYMLGSHQVQVTWSEVALCDSYEIYRSTSASSNGSKIGTASNSDGCVFVDKLSSSVDHTWYYYRIKAKSSYLGKTSDYSEQASVYVDKNPAPPCAPMNVKVSGSSSITIKWDKNTTSGCGTPTTQKVSIADDSQNGQYVDKVVTTNSCTLTSSEVKKYLNGGKTLIFFIMLSNDYGNACMYFEYDTSTQKITYTSTTSCY